MKKLIGIIAVVVIFTIKINAQWVSIPDTNFANYLQNHFPACMNGNLMDTACGPIMTDTLLDVSAALNTPVNLQIKDLTGVQYFRSLKKLICDTNRALTSIPLLPNSLTYLSCNFDSLVVFPVLPNGLRYLYCSGNQLSSYDSLPPNLQVFDCSNNQFTELDFLISSLKKLYCQNNQITLIHQIPGYLIDFDCSFNQLPALPQLLAVSLQRFICNNNQLTEFLIPLPNTLKIFNCSYNRFANFFSFPRGLTTLYCDNNLLTGLPELPDSLVTFYCNNNPGLSCLPELKKVIDFRFDSTNVTCLPNYPLNNSTSTPALSSVGLCNIFNNSGCAVFWKINGRVYNNPVQSCYFDNSSYALQNVKLKLLNNGTLLQQTYTNNQGFYSFDVDTEGVYEVRTDTNFLPFVNICPYHPTRSDSITLIDSVFFDQDFALECKNDGDLSAWSLEAGKFIPAEDTRINITAGDPASFNGLICAYGENINLNIAIIGPADFVVQLGTGFISESFNTVLMGEGVDANRFFTAFNFIIKTRTTALVGDQVCFDFYTTSFDHNSTNNSIYRCFTVGNTHEGNYKQASPLQNVKQSDWLTYTIHFQNNDSSVAKHILIDDTLDTALDESTFQLLAYSHQPFVQIKQNAVRFNFSNINLPDSSTNASSSQGYVQYKVKLKNNLSVGAVINNTASVRFNFNPPVITNTTSDTVIINTDIPSIGVQQFKITIYPNPATNQLNIKIDEALLGAQLNIYNLTGALIKTTQLQTINNKQETGNFPTGVYIAEVKLRDVVQRVRWVKM